MYAIFLVNVNALTGVFVSHLSKQNSALDFKPVKGKLYDEYFLVKAYFQ
jgi:hypothetical protein